MTGLTREEILRRSVPVSSIEYVELPFIRCVNLDESLCRESLELTYDIGHAMKETLDEYGVDSKDAVLFRTAEMPFLSLTEQFTATLNLADTDVVDGKTYAVQMSGEIVIKRVYRLPGGVLRLLCLDSGGDELLLTPELMRSQQAAVVGSVITLACNFELDTLLRAD